MKALPWILGILALLAIGGTVTFAILWNKEKKKNTTGNKTAPGKTPPKQSGTQTPTVEQIVGDPANVSGAAQTVARYGN